MSGIEQGQEAHRNPLESSVSSEPVGSSPAGEPITESPPSEGDAGDAAARRKILIGSQRDPAAYRARRQRDWTPVVNKEGEGQGTATPAGEGATGKPEGGEGRSRRHRHRGGHGSRDRRPEGGRRESAQPQTAAPQAGAQPSAPAAAAPSPVAAVARTTPDVRAQDAALVAGSASLAGVDLANPDTLSLARSPAVEEPPLPVVQRKPVAANEDDTPIVPGRRQRLSASMEAELDRAMGGLSLDDLMTGGSDSTNEGTLEPESRHHAKVVAIRRDEVFVDLGGREQGCVPVRMFTEPPQVGAMIDVIVQKFNPEEGLYDLSLPGTAVELGNWDDVQEGMLVDAMVTGHNTGGLEAEVNHLRGFIPVSQISLYRVEELSQFVGQKFTCLITEANPQRRNLVLSRRAVLEREKQEKKEQFRATLAPGQIYDGTVRKLMDFGAFVELGNGVDGLLHVSQLSWGRVKHPSEVLSEGQAVRVRIEKVDPESGRIGLSYRELTENPWTGAATKYLPNTTARGKVTRLMDFGAFCELEPGVEGLIHISELSHKRVWRASDVVKEGDEIEVMVLNVDPSAQRMSLSIKALSQPEPTKQEKEKTEEPELPPPAKKSNRPSNEPLQGGLGRAGGGARFGLKW